MLKQKTLFLAPNPNANGSKISVSRLTGLKTEKSVIAACEGSFGNCLYAFARSTSAASSFFASAVMNEGWSGACHILPEALTTRTQLPCMIAEIQRRAKARIESTPSVSTVSEVALVSFWPYSL